MIIKLPKGIFFEYFRQEPHSFELWVFPDFRLLPVLRGLEAIYFYLLLQRGYRIKPTT